MQYQYISAFVAAVGLVGTIVGIVSWYFSYQGTARRRNSILATIIAAIVCLTFLFVALSTPLGNTNSVTQIGAPHTPQNTVTSTHEATLTPTDTPTPTPSPTPTLPPKPKPGTVLYQADWSSGMNGWAGGDDWSSTGNLLINNGQQNTSVIIAPYHPGDNNIANYAIEAQIQLNRYTDEGQMGGVDSFGIIVRSPDGQQGYTFAICASSGFGFSNCGANSHEILISNGQNNIAENPYHPQYNDWHTYRVEVNSNMIKVSIDGGQFLSTTDNTYHSGGQVGLWSNRCQISIRSFKVIAL